MTLNKRKLVWFVMVAFVVVTCVGMNLALRNSENCLTSGERLSDARMMEIAIDAILSSYPPEIVKKVWVERSGKRFQEASTPGDDTRAFSLHQPDKPIAYDGSNDFLQKNPDCCSVVAMRSMEEGFPSRLRMLFGAERAYVRVTYRVRYLNEHGSMSEVKFQEYVGITSCGRAVRSAGNII